MTRSYPWRRYLRAHPNAGRCPSVPPTNHIRTFGSCDSASGERSDSWLSIVHGYRARRVLAMTNTNVASRCQAYRAIDDRDSYLAAIGRQEGSAYEPRSHLAPF